MKRKYLFSSFNSYYKQLLTLEFTTNFLSFAIRRRVEETDFVRCSKFE